MVNAEAALTSGYMNAVTPGKVIYMIEKETRGDLIKIVLSMESNVPFPTETVSAQSSGFSSARSDSKFSE